MTSDPGVGRPRADESFEPVTKESVRAAARARRAQRAVGLELATGHDRRANRALAVSQGHQTVACYASVGSEPQTMALMDALLAAGATVLLPVLRREPDWARYRGQELLRPGWRGIPEPIGPRLGPGALAEASVVWVSGLAGTSGGDRLGTGGGWYDRALSWAGPEARVGMLLYDDEVLDWLPTDPWDHPIHLIATESRLLECDPE